MGSSDTTTILRRKTSVGQQEHQARAMTVAKALRLTIARIAEETFEMSMSVIGIVVEKRSGDGCAELFEGEKLLAALDGPDRCRGAVVIDADIVGGLIQQQTMSRVSPPSGDARKMTSTDAAMCAPLVDAIFARVPPQLEVEIDRDLLTGFAFGARADEPRVLSMWLEAPEFQVIRMTFDMAGGARQGQMVLIIPCLEDRVPPDAKANESDAADTATPTLSDAVLSVPAKLNMILCRLTVPLSGVDALAVGDVLALPQNTFPDVDIATSTGRVIGYGTVGQVNGVRATRLNAEPIYASQPRRRMSDRDDLDLPEIEALPDLAAASEKKFALMDRREDKGAGAAKVEIPDLPAADAGDLADLPDLESLDLPDLGEVPDLDGLPDISVASDGPMDLETLPELDDLPDLASLPDLADLPQVG